MELLNKYKIRLDDPNMSMGLYKFFEYTIYNCVSFEYRLKYLQNGAIIFERHGRSYYHFQAFHRSKANVFSWSLKVIYGVFGLSSFLLFFATKSPAYICIVPILAALWLHRIVLDKSTRSNLFHIDKFLVNSNWLEKLLQIPLTDTDKFKNLAKQFYWNDLNMQIQENPEIIETQKFPGQSEEKIKDDSFKHQCETINCDQIIDFHNVKTLRDICSNEILSNKAIQILSEYFTDDGLVIKRARISHLSAILFVLAEKKYLSKTMLTNQDVQIIVSKLLDKKVSIDAVKYRAELEPKLKKYRRLFS